MSLTRKIESMLFELNDTYNKYGSEYMSHPYEQEQAITIQPELPIAPASDANMQLTDTRPPVEDEEYVPDNRKELGAALSALAADVPDASVHSLYRKIKDVIGSEPDPTKEPAEEAEAADDGLSEALKSFVRRMNESYWDDDDVEEDEGEIDPELDDQGRYIGQDIDQIPLKYLAQYYRDKPGKDQSKLRGSGESTVVTGTGRLLQQVVRPLIDVPKDQLADAVEYLRLQFQQVASKHLGLEKWPKEAPRTFQGLYFKKLVPKLDDSQLGANFLNTVVTDYKRRNKRWLKDLAEKALAEVASERSAYAKLRQKLEAEAPELAHLWPARSQKDS